MKGMEVQKKIKQIVDSYDRDLDNMIRESAPSTPVQPFQPVTERLFYTKA